MIRKFIKLYYKDNALEHAIATKGGDKAFSALKPSQGSHRSIIKNKNDEWQIDSTYLDIFVRDGEEKPFKPYLLSIVDMATGRNIVRVCKEANSAELVRFLWDAINLFGIPKIIKGDNGKDYKSERFQNALAGLGIIYKAAAPYRGDQKGMVERRFGVIQNCLRLTAGYVGNMANRMKIEESLKEKKDRKSRDLNGFVTKTHHEHLHTFAQIEKIVQNEVNAWNIRGNSERKKAASAMDLWQKDQTPIRKISYENFVLKVGVKTRRVVSKKGVNLNGVTYVSPDMPSVGTSVICRDNIDDISTIYAQKSINSI